jgi:hypothetical protein
MYVLTYMPNGLLDHILHSCCVFLFDINTSFSNHIYAFLFDLFTNAPINNFDVWTGRADGDMSEESAGKMRCSWWRLGAVSDVYECGLCGCGNHFMFRSCSVYNLTLSCASALFSVCLFILCLICVVGCFVAHF